MLENANSKQNPLIFGKKIHFLLESYIWVNRWQEWRMERTKKEEPGEDQPACLLICVDSILITIISSTEVKTALMKYSNALWQLAFGRHLFTWGMATAKKEKSLLIHSLYFKRGAREADDTLWCSVVWVFFLSRNFTLRVFSLRNQDSRILQEDYKRLPSFQLNKFSQLSLFLQHEVGETWTNAMDSGFMEYFLFHWHQAMGAPGWTWAHCWRHWWAWWRWDCWLTCAGSHGSTLDPWIHPSRPAWIRIPTALSMAQVCSHSRKHSLGSHSLLFHSC